MGRPLNKKFFQGLSASGFQIGCTAWFTGEGSSESAYIVEQTSNSTYVVESDAGPATRREELKLVQDAPVAAGEMQVLVTPQSSLSTIQGQTEADFDNVPPNGTFSAGTGYAGSDTITLSDGSVITVDTVSTGNVTEFTITTATTGSLPEPAVGATLTQVSTSGGGADFDLTLGAANVESSGTESARIINANQVKTFEGNRYLWPSISGASPSGLGEADLQETSS